MAQLLFGFNGGETPAEFDGLGPLDFRRWSVGRLVSMLQTLHDLIVLAVGDFAGSHEKGIGYLQRCRLSLRARYIGGPPGRLGRELPGGKQGQGHADAVPQLLPLRDDWSLVDRRVTNVCRLRACLLAGKPI